MTPSAPSVIWPCCWLVIGSLSASDGWGAGGWLVSGALKVGAGGSLVRGWEVHVEALKVGAGEGLVRGWEVIAGALEVGGGGDLVREWEMFVGGWGCVEEVEAKKW